MVKRGWLRKSFVSHIINLGFYLRAMGESVKCSAQLSDVIRFVVLEHFLEETSIIFNILF